MGRKPAGFWEDQSNAIAEAEKAKRKFGVSKLPPYKVLKKNGFGGLISAIQRVYGGFYEFRLLLGETPSRTKYGKWTDIDYVVEEAQVVLRKHGIKTLPAESELDRLGHTKLGNAITNHHGFVKVRNLLHDRNGTTNVDYISEARKKPNGYWKDVGNAVAEARRIKRENELDRLPNANELEEMGESALGHAITDHHGGYFEFRKLLGEEEKDVRKGVWKDLSYGIAQARAVMRELGCNKLPSANVLRDRDYHGLVVAIGDHYGGMDAFRRALGENPKRTKHGQWRDLDYCLRKARALKKKLRVDKLPSSDHLSGLELSGLENAITNYHGGFTKFRHLLGEEKVQVPMGSWSDEEFTVRYARDLMERESLSRLPSQDVLASIGESGLGRAIGKYHGGFPVFRRLLEERAIGATDKSEIEGILREYVS